jgi:hypothetical protein
LEKLFAGPESHSIDNDRCTTEVAEDAPFHVHFMDDGTFGNRIGLDGIILRIELLDKRCYAIKTHDCKGLKS